MEVVILAEEVSIRQTIACPMLMRNCRTQFMKVLLRWEFEVDHLCLNQRQECVMKNQIYRNQRVTGYIVHFLKLKFTLGNDQNMTQRISSSTIMNKWQQFEQNETLLNKFFLQPSLRCSRFRYHRSTSKTSLFISNSDDPGRQRDAHRSALYIISILQTKN